MKIPWILLLCMISESASWQIFHKGRIVGGNLGHVSVPEGTVLPADQWFEQTLDHFQPTDGRTWRQRYHSNDGFFKKRGDASDVVFLNIGGEGPVNSTFMVEGQWVEYAKQFGAFCFQLEHRFYGKSHPTKDMSVKNLQYLSSQQALADLATFIQAMNAKYSFEGAKWIVFGGSYSGALAAWLRYKYPHLVTGAMSASGPLLAQVNFYEYFAVVRDSLNTYSSDCAEAVYLGTKQVESLLKHMVGERSLYSKFKLCDHLEKSINKPNDIANFFETLSGNFAGVVQYNKDNRKGKNPKAAKITIDTVCDIMTNFSSGPAVNRLAAVNTLLLDAYDLKCLDYKYDNMITALRNISWNSETAEGGRQWTYQTCTEFGFYQTSDDAPPMFGDKFPLSFFVQQCMDIFGSKFNQEFLDRAAERTNTIYGGLDLEVSNVVFVQGSIDPWHALGITKTRDNKAPAIYINGTAHCANMYPRSPDDLPQLNAARVFVGQLIDTWIRLG